MPCAPRHRAAILRFHCRQVSEVEPRTASCAFCAGREISKPYFAAFPESVTAHGDVLPVPHADECGFEIFAFFQTGLEIGKLQFGSRTR